MDSLVQFYQMMRRDWLYLSFICLLVIVAYFGVWNFGFVYDDFTHLVNNQSIRSLVPLTKFIVEPGIFIGNLEHPLNWRPVAAFAQAVSWNLFGDSAGYHHLVNLLLHLLNLVLIYILLRMFLKERRLVMVTTLIYGVHPVLTEAVDWISSQNTLLWTLFFLLACIAILKRHSWISYFFFALALLTKETAIAGTVVLPVILWIQARENKISRPAWREISRSSWLYLLIAGLYVFMRWIVLGSVASYSYGTWLVTPMVFWKYVNLVFLPVHLIIPYDFYSNIPIPQSFLDGRVIGGLFYVCLFIIWFWRSLKYRRWPEVFGLTWFLAFLAPVLQIVPFIDLFGERALYAPALGLILASISLVRRWCGNFSISENWQRFSFVGLALMFVVMTFTRSQAWRNPLTIWESTLKIDQRNAIAYLNLGIYYLSPEGYDPKKSIEWSQKLLDFWPNHATARTNLGLAYEKLGDYDRAEKEFLDVLSEHPGFVSAENKLAYLYWLMNVNGGLMGRVTGNVTTIKIYGVTQSAFFREETPEVDGSFRITLRPGTYYLKSGNLISDQFVILKDFWSEVELDIY